MKTSSECRQDLVRKYREAGQKWPASASDVARWAIQSKLWEPSPSAIISQCAEEISRAMRDEHIFDAQGRRVRAKHVVMMRDGETQRALWDDIRSAPASHMRMAFQQRRRQIVGDCKQLKADVDSYNENRSPDIPIQIIFDFTRDLEESELLRKRAR